MWKKTWKFSWSYSRWLPYPLYWPYSSTYSCFNLSGLRASPCSPLHDKDFVILSRIDKTFNRGWDYGDIVVIDRRIDRKRSIWDDIKDIGIFNRMENRNLIIKRIIGLPTTQLRFAAMEFTEMANCWKNHTLWKSMLITRKRFTKCLRIMFCTGG